MSEQDLEEEVIEKVKFTDLIDRTITKIENIDNERLIFHIKSPYRDHEDDIYEMYHSQDCCEDVRIEEITGDLDDLIGTPILKAGEEISFIDDKRDIRTLDDERNEWTFYKLATIKGYVDIRWYGSSNGYYGTEVDFIQTYVGKRIPSIEIKLGN